MIKGVTTSLCRLVACFRQVLGLSVAFTLAAPASRQTRMCRRASDPNSYVPILLETGYNYNYKLYIVYI